MRKIMTERAGDFTGTVYLYSLGYGFKIVYHRKVVGRSYVYLTSKEDCVNKMLDELKFLSGFNKDLFDLERL